MEQLSKESISSSTNIPSLNAFGEVDNNSQGNLLSQVGYHAPNDASLFSSSLPVLPHGKFQFACLGISDQSVDDGSPILGKLCNNDENKDTLEDVEINAIGNMLPDDEVHHLAGIMDDFDLNELPSQLEDLEEYDVFGSGGIEMDFDPQEGLSIGMSQVGLSDGLIGHFGFPNGIGAVAGEHPYGEHPSRTLFVRNINSNVEDSELQELFEQFGDIRTLYTSCKHRGFVMISYYDIRAARTAMRSLQNKPLRRRKLDIHFSIPKDNPSEKDINQGTLVVFNLDSSVSNDDLRQIFGNYGEVKEIRETPHKRHHKFIEFYDVRAAEAALRSLNRCDIAGKRIKLEPSRPGGQRRNLLQQLNQELQHDEVSSFRHHVGSPLTNSPPGNWAQFGNSVEHNPLQAFSQSPDLGTLRSINGSHLTGLASILPPLISSSTKIAPIGRDHGRANLSQIHAHSYPDQKLSVSPGLTSSFSESNLSGIGTLSGPQFLWGSPSPYSERPIQMHTFPSELHTQRYSFPTQPSSIGSTHHHVGSAPSGVPIDGHFGYFPNSPDTSYMSTVGFRSMSPTINNAGYVMNIGGQRNMAVAENSGFRMMPLMRYGPMFPGNSSYPRLNNNDGLGRHVDNNAIQNDTKKQYQLDLERIKSGADIRTTIMIKNIPNKYTSKMLLSAIDENHKDTYDFLYLPIDFKNKCNVGYAFINMVSHSHIIRFYEALNGKRWEKFNSEKVASLAYARIQGKAALITHFQNSSLMNEDKRCRPILFHSESQMKTDQGPFPSSNLNICIRLPDGSYSGDSLESPRGDNDENPNIV